MVPSISKHATAKQLGHLRSGGDHEVPLTLFHPQRHSTGSTSSALTRSDTVIFIHRGIQPIQLLQHRLAQTPFYSPTEAFNRVNFYSIDMRRDLTPRVVIHNDSNAGQCELVLDRHSTPSHTLTKTPQQEPVCLLLSHPKRRSENKKKKW